MIFWHADDVQGVDDLIMFWQNSVNSWLDYLHFPTLAFCVVKQNCEQISGESLGLGS